MKAEEITQRINKRIIEHMLTHGTTDLLNNVLDDVTELSVILQSMTIKSSKMGEKSCDTCGNLKSCGHWEKVPNNGATCKFYIKYVK